MSERVDAAVIGGGQLGLVAPSRRRGTWQTTSTARAALRHDRRALVLTESPVVIEESRAVRADAAGEQLDAMLGHLAGLEVLDQRGRAPVTEREVSRPRLLGYGDWTGFASASRSTLPLQNRSARCCRRVKVSLLG